MNKSILIIAIFCLTFSCSSIVRKSARSIASSKDCRVLLLDVIRLGEGVDEYFQLPSDVRKLSMHKSYEGEEKGDVFQYRVNYLSESERMKYRVYVNDKGELVDRDGKVFGSDSLREHESLYVIGTDGALYVMDSTVVGDFHHSSFLAGGDVVAAGMIEIIRGKIDYIDNSSGHYMPSNRTLDRILDILESHKVRINQVGSI